MTRLVLVRHGETIWHAENRYAGRADIPLTPYGQNQALQLARWAVHAGLSAVWSSPLSRARLTARPAAEAAHVPLQTDARLTEVDFGRWEGLTDQEMRKQFPKERAAFVEDPSAASFPDGEDPFEAARRGTSALHDIARAAGPDSRVLVVAHNTLLRIVLCSLFNIPLSQYRTTFPLLANGALTEIRFNSGHVGLLSLNQPIEGPTCQTNQS